MTFDLRKRNLRYQLNGKSQAINHLLFTDELKLHGNDEAQVNSLVNTVHYFSDDIRSKLELKTCGIMYLRKWQGQSLAGIELPNRELIKQIGTKATNALAS